MIWSFNWYESTNESTTGQFHSIQWLNVNLPHVLGIRSDRPKSIEQNNDVYYCQMIFVSFYSFFLFKYNLACILNTTSCGEWFQTQLKIISFCFLDHFHFELVDDLGLFLVNQFYKMKNFFGVSCRTTKNTTKN